MKKKALSLALTLAICLGLTVPAFAAAPTSEAEGTKNISISIGLDALSQEDLMVEEPWIQYDIEAETGAQQAGYTAIKKDTVITVTHSGTEDDGSTLRVELFDYLKLGAMDEVFPNQIVRGTLGAYGYELTADGWGTEADRVELKAGESKSFTIPFEDERFAVFGADEDGGAIYSDVFQVVAIMHDPQSNSDFTSSLFVKENAAAYNAAAAKASTSPSQPQQPDAPAYQVSNWAKDRVAVAVEKGLAADSLGNDYRVNITRAQFAATAVKLYEAMSGQKAEATGESSFTDTTDPVILLAADLGFVSGVGGGKFDPSALVNREQAAVMLSSVYTRLGGEIPAVTSTTFADNGDVAGWAKSAVAFMNSKEIVTGVGNNSFSPKGSASIEQALLISLKMFETLK